jgi:succinate-semialdehyde dehydrogenase/glutarate-semialdehyde dehydrogenase
VKEFPVFADILKSMDEIKVRNPATGQLAGSVSPASLSELSETVARARQAQQKWSKLSFEERAAIVARFHDLVIDRSGSILDTIQMETGKTRRDAFAEVVSVAGTARYYLSHGRSFLASRSNRGAVPVLTSSVLRHRPHGVVGLITPWNYPFLLSMADALPALLAGNAVVLKPSELTPLSAVLGRSTLIDSGLDPDLFGIVHGTGEVGSELIRHVDYIGFTGGSVTGRKVAVAAAERLIPCSLELGGKNPMIVLKGASLQNAALGMISGAFSNAGQTCISVERVYVESSVFDEFARIVVDNTRKLKMGWSPSWDLDVGSLIHGAQADKVMGHIDEAVQCGARVLTGGRRRGDLGPAFVEPTILSHVGRRSPISTQETFGPVVALYPVDSANEAVVVANDTDYGLNASVWAGESGEAMEVARQIDAGSVGINSTLMIYNSFDVPMGGIRQSGLGRRHGEHGILRYTQEQSIVSSFSAGGGYDSLLARIRTPKLADNLLKLVRLWRRIPGLR